MKSCFEIAKIALSSRKCLSSYGGVQQLKLRLRTNKAVVRRALGSANQQPRLGHPTSKPLLESLDCIGCVILQNMLHSAAVQGHVGRMMIVMSCESHTKSTYCHTWCSFGGVSSFLCLFARLRAHLMSLSCLNYYRYKPKAVHSINTLAGRIAIAAKMSMPPRNFVGWAMSRSPRRQL